MPIQQHTHIRPGNAKLCRYLVVCDFVNVHLADQLACPTLQQI
nr:MAG TPA_asm: hypothetical protein [Caudoviricetes sp.]DAX55457.1 MAG TPA: hypothetical protein [Caudoviricetes sp.]